MYNMYQPLADKVRPTTLDEVVGQTHILAKNGVLRRSIEKNNISNMIFHGPSGVGKTTVAKIIAKETNRKFVSLNATTASTSDIKQLIGELDTLLTPHGILLYLDEIQYFNKKQQQSLLEFIENGKIILIASTTENPYFYIYNAILSRSILYEFKPVAASEIEKALIKLFDEVEISDSNLNIIANAAFGDVRKAINISETLLNLAITTNGIVTLDDIIAITGNSRFRYDKNGDEHYNILSAFQKSIRGSDADASVHYLARLLKAGDLQSICRRLLVIATEDIGLAYPQAISIVKSCVDSAFMLGFPEARIPLAHATILLATAPKSNSAYLAINAALMDLDTIDVGDIPTFLKDTSYLTSSQKSEGHIYQYPHEFENHYVKQQYLPNNIQDKIYYKFQANKHEKNAMEYWDNIKHPKQKKRTP